MLLSVLTKITPQMRGQSVLIARLGLQDVFNLRASVRNFRKLKRSGFPESDHIDALSMLGNDSSRVHNGPVDIVAKFILKSAKYYFECPASVMMDQVLYVLQQKGRRALGRDDSFHFEEQRPLGRVAEAMRPTKTTLLGDSRD